MMMMKKVLKVNNLVLYLKVTTRFPCKLLMDSQLADQYWYDKTYFAEHSLKKLVNDADQLVSVMQTN